MKLSSSLLCAVAMSLSVSVFAGWSSNETRLGGASGKLTWVYTPDSSIASNPNIIEGKRALMINLHGCAQSNEDLQGAGNWEDVAEEFGMVVAVPFAESSYPGCWDYNLAQDGSNHAAVLVNIVNQLLGDSSLSIDAKQVYVSGLSSGGAMAAQLACEYPHVFAGIGSVAGPSVGSDQDTEALGDTPAGNVSRGTNKCNQLANASGHASELQTQISQFAYGDRDRNGDGTTNAGNQGTIALVDVNWVIDNAQIMKNVYGAGSLGSINALMDAGGATAKERVSKRGGKEVVSLLDLDGVGHAWPAGSKESEWTSGGAYLNKAGYEYPLYLTQWLFANNLRVDSEPPANYPPQISLPAGPYEYAVGDDCVPDATASDVEDGNLSSNVTISGSANCNAEGSYNLTYYVQDSAGASDTVSITVVVSDSNTGGVEETVTSSCTSHYMAGRLNVNGYLSCGSGYGWSAQVTMYRVGSCWTFDSAGAGC